MLTAHQNEVGDQLLRAIRKGAKRTILQGSAGVGKTWLVSEIVKGLVRDYTINPNTNNGTIYITAPTNKALSILQGKIPAYCGEFRTIHSALGMKLVTNGFTGDRKFVKAWTRFEKGKEFNNCKICVVDEASMVNTEILEFLDEEKFPIIFIGDNQQINPVGEETSPVFMRNYPVFELKEIIRQGEGNPIIDLSRDLDKMYFKTPKLNESKGYVFDSNRLSFIEQLAEVNGTDELKYLSYYNDDVDEINLAVRRRIYGEKPARVELGEVLVFNRPLNGYYTNQEVKVEDLKIITDFVEVPTEKARYEFDYPSITQPVRMKFYQINNNFRIVHEDSDNLYRHISTTLKANCSRYNWNWKGFYFFTEQFGDTKYNHAITVHKSQGSTYKNVILNVGNINKNRNVAEKTRLLYTGVTRASDLLILYGI